MDCIPKAHNGLKRVFSRFISDQGGATAIEYALIAGMLSIAIVASVIAVGDGISSVWNYISDEVTAGLAR